MKNSPGLQQFSLIVAFLISLTVQSQSDTLMAFDSHGRKKGYWPVYLDSNGHFTDSATAFFIAYEFYSNGKNVYDFYHQKWKLKDSAVFVGVDGIRGAPVAATGKFTWYDKKSQMITFEEAFEKGFPSRFKEVRYKKKNRRYTWAFIRTRDFSKRYRGLPGSYMVLEQNNMAIYNLPEWSKFWFRPGKRGWKKYRIGTQK
jgi:hypothetical protein